MKFNPSTEEREKNFKKRKKVTPSKSDHKHDYSVPVLYKWELGHGHTHYFVANDCSICGKVGGRIPFFMFDENGHLMEPEEIIEKYKHLPKKDYKR